jgi:hypothetical protein
VPAIVGASMAEKAVGYNNAMEEAMKLYAEDSNLFASQEYLASKMADVGITNQDLI